MFIFKFERFDIFTLFKFIIYIVPQFNTICVPILPNQTHVKIFKNDIFAFYVSIHPYETEKKVW